MSIIFKHKDLVKYVNGTYKYINNFDFNRSKIYIFVLGLRKYTTLSFSF